jgi:alkylation response protein AidB-like acyl-CoA dehydrogenase
MMKEAPVKRDAQGTRDHFAEKAHAVDAGTADVRAGLAWLGARDLLGGDLAEQVTVVRAIAGGCLASAFAVWSQNMVLGYLGADAPDGLRSGRATGATALAPAIADVAGRVPVPVVAEPDGTGWRLRGPIRWASNLFPGAVVVTPARTPDGGRLVAAFGLDTPGVVLQAPAELLALNGTGTAGLHLDGVRVPAGDVLSRDLGSFVGACRPAMLLMQTALAVGLADAAVAASGQRLTGTGTSFAGDHDALATRHREIGSRLDRLAAEPVPSARRELATVRLDAIALAADAVWLETAVTGGAGYGARSDTARRLREAAFLPVQAPTAGQLRAELA